MPHGTQKTGATVCRSTTTRRLGQALSVAGIRPRTGTHQRQRGFWCGGEFVAAGEFCAEINAACDRVLARRSA